MCRPNLTIFPTVTSTFLMCGKRCDPPGSMMTVLRALAHVVLHSRTLI